MFMISCGTTTVFAQVKHLQNIVSVDEVEWNGIPGKTCIFYLNELEYRLIMPSLAFQNDW